LLLPLPRHPSADAEWHRLRRLERDLLLNPQRHLDYKPRESEAREGEAPAEPAPCDDLPNSHLFAGSRLGGSLALPDPRRGKREAMALPTITHAERVARFHALRLATNELRPMVADRIDAVRRELADADRLRRIDAIAAERDYSFCLHPEEMLRSFFGDS
jgi:hypothetical protein